jgi:hypothetical protein
MSIPTTKPRNAFPGDTARIVTRPATDTTGREWKVGETMIPLAGGYDNERGCQYMETTGGARFEAERA